MGVDESGGPFDGEGVDGWPELDYDNGGRWFGRVVDDVAHGDGVDARAAGRFAAGDFPDARGAAGVGVGGFLELDPFCVGRGEVR